ncbi:DUF6414 family protein [Mesorhizobium erdmanii]|uniref:DUF6414 family protein n=1 Tax=Mesorhizobium erdmanii TaxID=1777866 RepID=UPI0012B5067A|nr:hypothetical protein [Mesorhizobium erdmanii]
MSKNDEKASDGGRDGQKDDSVYDFLYFDTQRVGSFLAQFDPSGHLQEVTQHESVAKGTKRGFSVKLGGGASYAGTGGTGEVSFERGPSEIGSESSDLVYDPLWANARDFLDYLNERNLLHRDIKTARIGQIVLSSGNLAVFDLGVLRGMWDLPTVKKAILKGASAPALEPSNASLNRHGKRAAEAAKIAKQQSAPSEAELAIEMLTVLPHTTQAAVSSSDGNLSVWFNLAEKNMTISATNLFLKHGLTIAGTWNIVGVLDAMPDQETIPGMAAIEQMLAGTKLSFLTQSMAGGLVPAVRTLLGRPTDSFGVTPLLLFREIAR